METTGRFHGETLHLGGIGFKSTPSGIISKMRPADTCRVLHSYLFEESQMFLTITALRTQLGQVILSKNEQGHQTEGLEAELTGTPDSYDALFAFAERLAHLPLRVDWPYDEPSEREDIWAACDPDRPGGPIAKLDLADSAHRVKAAFLGSVCGCILGKPLEINPSLYEIQSALSQLGEWPLNDYISERIATYFDRPLHSSWTETVRERIRYAAPDDDINYTILGMLQLEQHGLKLSKTDIREAWLLHLPPRWTFGPERVLLARAALNSRTDTGRSPQEDLMDWVSVLNPMDEYCGAMIRADAYGYACPGRPALAAELAWRDASWTHRRTGIYGTMFMAAAIAAAQVLRDPLAVFDTALKFVPRRSRFYQIEMDALNIVADARDWLDGYERIYSRYAAYRHCRIFQESATLINTLRFAESIGDGICKQVAQGNDTDSYGCSAGSLLGAFFGPGYLEQRWLTPFNDEIRTALGAFEERSLSALAKRISRLPQHIAAELAAEDLKGV
jgi:ADP-ribosylglycohydrolase